MAVLTNPVERSRFLKFMAVGAVGAVIDFGMANLLAQYAGLKLVIAGSISFACAIISNFVWNRFWTYPESRSRPIANQLGMFSMVNVAGLAIRIPILHFAEPALRTALDPLPRVGSLSPEFVARNATLAIAVGIVMLWNFFVNRYWTYADVDLPQGG